MAYAMLIHKDSKISKDVHLLLMGGTRAERGLNQIILKMIKKYGLEEKSIIN